MVLANWAQRVMDPSLTVLLGLQIIFIFVGAPLASLGMPFPSVIGGALILALVIVTVLLSGSRSAIALVLAAMILGAAGLALRLHRPSVATEVLGHGASTTALLALSFVVARAVFRPGRITFHRIRGAIVLYLNIALIFTSAYRLIVELEPDSFRNLATGRSEFVAIDSILYFSFTTLTSTGFGDIVPVDPIARSLSNLEAIIGQLYPATLLARIVTLELRDREQ